MQKRREFVVEERETQSSWLGSRIGSTHRSLGSALPHVECFLELTASCGAGCVAKDWRRHHTSKPVQNIPLQSRWSAEQRATDCKRTDWTSLYIYIYRPKYIGTVFFREK